MNQAELEFVDEDDAVLDKKDAERFHQAVLYATDWTVETILSQMSRGNIDMNPRFQRRDAWNFKGKSRFVESIVLGLPIPQIVLAEKHQHRGQFIVLDGKQRLLSLLQYAGKAEGDNNGFALTGLEARPDLNRVRYEKLRADPGRIDDFNAFNNHTIRTVVIRSWPNREFLHLVFLRLNTGSLKLSPQELRQAMVPGPFVDFADDHARSSKGLHDLLSIDNPDPRMRDVELLVRYFGFRRFLEQYGGRMKQHLDDTCEKLNKIWASGEDGIRVDADEFEAGASTLIDVFGASGVARKLDSPAFNRAIFDSLIYYASMPALTEAIRGGKVEMKQAYSRVVSDDAFREAVESDTAGIPNTHARLRIWGEVLRDTLGVDVPIPVLSKDPGTGASRIRLQSIG